MKDKIYKIVGEHTDGIRKAKNLHDLAVITEKTNKDLNALFTLQVVIFMPTEEDIQFEMDTNYSYKNGMEGTYEEGKYVGFDDGSDFVIEHIKKRIKGN